MRGLTRSLALERDGNRLVSRSAMVCGFVKMQGAGAYEERLLPLRGTEIGLRFDGGWPDDPHLLDGVLGTERIAHRVHRIARPPLPAGEPLEPEPDLSPQPSPSPAGGVAGYWMVGPSPGQSWSGAPVTRWSAAFNTSVTSRRTCPPCAA